MTSKQVTTEINMPVEVFTSNLKEKIRSYERGTMDALFDFESIIQWDNVTLEGNRIEIVKSMRPFGKTKGFGRIEAKITENDNKTIITAKITLDTAFSFMKYVVGIMVGWIGLMWLMLDFDFFVLLFILLIELIVFGIAPRMFLEGLDDLTKYYYSVIRASIKQNRTSEQHNE